MLLSSKSEIKNDIAGNSHSLFPTGFCQSRRAGGDLVFALQEAPVTKKISSPRGQQQFSGVSFSTFSWSLVFVFSFWVDFRSVYQVRKGAVLEGDGNGS